ncbi:MAG: pilus assembly protein [Anaerolineales bacterium]|jgi:hypothetical protein
MTVTEPRPRAEKGQSLVEFAITLVILLILLVGIADVGRMLFTFMALRDAAQEGAAFGSVNPTGDISGRVVESSSFVEDMHNAGEITISINHDGTPCAGEALTVQVTYSNFVITVPFLGAIAGSQTIPISAGITDTILTPPCN